MPEQSTQPEFRSESWDAEIRCRVPKSFLARVTNLASSQLKDVATFAREALLEKVKAEEAARTAASVAKREVAA